MTMRSAAPVIAEGLFSFQIGGSERVGVDLALEFRRRGYEVICFAFYDSDGPMRRELERAGVRCLDMNYEKYDGLTRRLVYQRDFLRMLRREGVSALHVHHATALILCGIPARLAGIRRVVMTEHGLYQLQERPTYRKSAARYCRFAHEITVVEPTQIHYFHSEMGVPLSRLHHIANGVRLRPKTPAHVQELRRRLGIADGTFAYFYVGRLSPVKDLATLVNAFALLPEITRSRARLFLAGDGTERDMLEKLCRSLGMNEKITFLGVRNDVSEILMAADAFVMSSRTEGLPMSLLEAMAATVPCVATAVGGIPALFADGRGLLVPPSDPAQLASAMARVAESAQLREQMVSRSLENVRQQYSLDLVVDQYLSLLGLAAWY